MGRILCIWDGRSGAARRSVHASQHKSKVQSKATRLEFEGARPVEFCSVLDIPELLARRRLLGLRARMLFVLRTLCSTARAYTTHFCFLVLILVLVLNTLPLLVRPALPYTHHTTINQLPTLDIDRQGTHSSAEPAGAAARPC